MALLGSSGTRRIAPALLGCHLPDHQRTALQLIANHSELGQSLLLRAFPRALHHITSDSTDGTSVSSFAGAITDDRREIRCVGGRTSQAADATHPLTVALVSSVAAQTRSDGRVSILSDPQRLLRHGTEGSDRCFRHTPIDSGGLLLVAATSPTVTALVDGGGHRMQGDVKEVERSSTGRRTGHGTGDRPRARRHAGTTESVAVPRALTAAARRATFPAAR